MKLHTFAFGAFLIGMSFGFVMPTTRHDINPHMPTYTFEVDTAEVDPDPAHIPQVQNYAAFCEMLPGHLGNSSGVHNDIDIYLIDAAGEFGVDVRSLAVTMYRESKCDPKALGSSGEIGLMQVHPKVWVKELRKIGIKSEKSLWDPQQNIRAGAYIMSHLSVPGRKAEHVFRRYNGSGPAARKYGTEQVDRYKELFGSEPEIKVLCHR